MLCALYLFGYATGGGLSRQKLSASRCFRLWLFHQQAIIVRFGCFIGGVMRNWLNGQWLLLLLIQLPLTAFAGGSASGEVQALIDRAEAPEGVVFEIVSAQSRYLDWALPEAARLSMRLRDAFPGLDIAIVSHGTEQFALTRERLEHNGRAEQQSHTGACLWHPCGAPGRGGGSLQ